MNSDRVEKLSINGLTMPDDFPTLAYEAIYRRAFLRSKSLPVEYDNFASAWNAIAYRFLEACEIENRLPDLLRTGDAGDPQHRFRQESDLFAFFSNLISVFESSFYGLYSLGAMLDKATFPIATERDRQRISPSSTASCISKAFGGDAINQVIAQILADQDYLESREVRNILTHRAAPGRTFFVGLGSSDEPLADQWKIKGIILDERMAPERKMQAARMLLSLLTGIQAFVEARMI
jgi:hypothetical protein